MSNQIDTYDVLGKIAVMEAFAKGSPIEFRPHNSTLWSRTQEPKWNWEWGDYRIQELADDEIIIVTYSGKWLTDSSRPFTSYKAADEYMDYLRENNYVVSHRVYKEKKCEAEEKRNTSMAATHPTEPAAVKESPSA